MKILKKGIFCENGYRGGIVKEITAYNKPSAPRTNLSEVYNSNYVRANKINLKLLDTAKLDTCEALKYEKTFKKYGEGMPVAGSGPLGSQRYEQSKKKSQEVSRCIVVRHGKS